MNNGSFDTSNYDGRYLTFAWSVKSQNIATNQTTISWSLKGAGGPLNTWYMSGNFKVVINNVTVYSSATRIKLFNGTTVASGEYTITHNADGNKSFSASAEAGIYTVAVNCRGNGSWDLPQIPRQATIISATNFTDEQNPTINYTNPAGNNVTTLRAYIQNAAGTVTYVQYKELSKTDTSYTFELTNAERDTLRDASPNSNNLTVKFVIETIIGGNIFNSTLNKTMTIVNANPSISGATYEDTKVETTDITQNPLVIIRNKSTLEITVDYIHAYKGATLTSLVATINGVSKTKSLSGTLASNIIITFGTINVSSNISASLVATDSRGNKYTYNLPITVWDWVLPSAIITCQRKNNYYTETDINVNADYSSLDNKNQITIQYQYKKTTDPDTSYSALATLQDNVTTTFNIDNTYAWNIRVIITDLLGTTTYNLVVNKGVPFVYFDRLNNSTGFNCFPQNQGSVEINGALLINNRNINDMLTGVGGFCETATSDWDTACNNKTGFFMGQNLSNSPSGTTASGWWWVLNIVHNANYQRQIAFSFVENSGIYTRIKNNGTWNSWTQV